MDESSGKDLVNGEAAPIRDCYCDSSCIQFNDCCEDHAETCIHLYTTSTKATLKPTTKATTTAVMMDEEEEVGEKVTLKTDCGMFMSALTKAFKGLQSVGEVSANCENNVCVPFCKNEGDKYTGPPKLVCQVKGKKTKIIPSKGKLICDTPKDTPCGNLAPKFVFAEGHDGKFECSQIKKDHVCEVKCADDTLAPTLSKVTCRVLKRGSVFLPNQAPPIACISK